MAKKKCGCKDHKVTRRPIGNEIQIEQFLHCGLCIKELPEGVSPKEYQSVQVGWTKQGLQVWCKRHDCNVVHIDFQGACHPANTTRKATERDRNNPFATTKAEPEK